MTPIHHTFGPHIDGAYMRKVLAMSYAPWRYKRGKSVETLRNRLAEKFGGRCALFASGREALLGYLRAINLKPGEEVIVQAYTCVVVPNAVHAAGGVAVYADITEDTLNLSAESVGPLITARTRAVICQHTFGIPSGTTALRALCSEKKILLIEDCAHVIPDETGPHEIGTLGDAVLLSFGRDKAVSGIAGGAFIVKDDAVAQKLLAMEAAAPDLSLRQITVLLEYASRMRSVIRPLIGTGMHRPVIAALNRLGIYAPILTEEEREGHMSPVLHRMPNACAFLALHSLSHLREINDHRRQLTAFYLEHGNRNGWPMLAAVHSSLPLQKFPLFVRGADAKRTALKAHNVHLNDGWTGCVICPDTVDPADAGYDPGSDPKAEKVCRQILSLPTHPTMTIKQAVRLAGLIDESLSSQ